MGDAAGSKPKAGSKTATFIMKSQKSNGVPQADPRIIAANQDSKAHKRFFFKNPETGKYEGPLSLSPQSMDDLTAFRKINGVKVSHAYVRYEVVKQTTSGTSALDDEYTPLYKA